MQAAYLTSALCRRAKLTADTAGRGAARRADQAIRDGRGAVVPIGQARRSRAAAAPTARR